MSQLNAENHAKERTDSSRYPRIYPVTEGIRSNKTAIIYERCFNRFLDHIKIHDRQVLLDFSPKVIKQMIIDYILYLRDDKRLICGTIRVHLAAILHFFQINNDEFNLTARNFRLHLPSDDSVNDDRPYTVEEIGQVLQDCDPRSKAVILLLCSTGMRMGTLHSMQIGDLTPVQLGSIQLYKIQVYARTRDKYITFTTPECCKAIQFYLNHRERCGEKLQPKSPLIREQFNKDNPFTVNAPRFISDRAIEYLIDSVLKESGVRKPGEVHMSHGMRKFFISQCESSPMKSLFVDVLANHDTGVKKHYLRIRESELLQEYLKAVDALTISQESKLKQQVQDLEGQQMEEIVQLKERVKDLDEHVHRWSKAFHALDDGKIKRATVKSAVTGKTKRLYKVEDNEVRLDELED